MYDFSNVNIVHITIFAASLILAFLTGIVIIPVLRKIRFGQTVRNDGPKSHLKKMGIPTMGGFIFLVPTLIFSIVGYGYFPQLLPLVFSAVGFGFIGFLDDYIKVVKKEKTAYIQYKKQYYKLL